MLGHEACGVGVGKRGRVAGLGKGDIPGGVFGLYFLILCHHSPTLTDNFPVNLWIIRKTNSDHV